MEKTTFLRAAGVSYTCTGDKREISIVQQASSKLM